MYRNIFKTLFLSFVVLLFSSCVAKLDREHTSYKKCEVISPKFSMRYKKIKVNCASGDPRACLALYGVIIPVGSTVVVGSIVVVGNTVHWLEYQGRCENSTLRSELRKMKKRLDI